MKVIGWITCILIGVGIMVYFCSPNEQRSEAADRVETAANALRGESSDRVPEIVARQRRKELKRQNTQWTAENRALHPVEYCQAQLEILKTYSDELEVAAHKIAVTRNTTARQKMDAEKSRVEIERFLVKAKDAYRKADVGNAWPTKFNGFALTKDQFQEKIVEAANKVQPLKEQEIQKANLISALSHKAARVIEEQKRLVTLRDRIQETITDLNTKKVIDGEKGIKDALDAINDSIDALGRRTEDPSLRDLMEPSAESNREEMFNAIMAK